MYGTLPAPSDFLGGNQHTLHPHRLRINGHDGPDSDSHSPTMSEPRSPILRHSFSADLPSHLASLYNSQYAAAAVAAAVAGQGGGVPQSNFTPYGRAPVPSPFYPGMGAQDCWRRPAYLSQLELCWPPNFRPMDAIVGPRTKAPREATSILKNWLNEHKDNPYPTKSEKVTLSIVTHMTLTQVSTWFANARRRIKKESKITWTPKPRCNDQDENSSNEEENEKENHMERQKRSPRDYVSDERRRSIHERDTQRDYRVSDAGSSSSLLLTSEASHRSQVSDSPMFPSFHRIQPQLYPAAAAAAAASLFNGPSAAFRRHIFPHLLADTHKDGSMAQTKNVFHYQDSAAARLNREREKGKKSSAEQKEEGESRETSPFGHGRYQHNDSTSDKEVNTDLQDLSPSPPKEERFSNRRCSSKSSFINTEKSELLNEDKRTPSPGKKEERQLNENSPREKNSFREKSLFDGKERRISANSCGKSSDELSLAASPNASESKISATKAKSTTTSCSSPENFHDKDCRRDQSSQDENFDAERAISSPLFPPLFNSGFLPGSQTMVPKSGNCDVFSSWIRDFQQLVATGQANKAKQALASALAMAAKAGAYSCHATGVSPPFYRQEQGNRSPEYRRLSTSPRQFSCINRHSPLSSSRHSSRTTSNGSSSPRSYRFSDESLKLNARGCSRRYSDSPPPNKRDRSMPQSPHDSLPINLSKSCDDWKHTPLVEGQSKVEV